MRKVKTIVYILIGIFIVLMVKSLLKSDLVGGKVNDILLGQKNVNDAEDVDPYKGYTKFHIEDEMVNDTDGNWSGTTVYVDKTYTEPMYLVFYHSNLNADMDTCVVADPNLSEYFLPESSALSTPGEMLFRIDNLYKGQWSFLSKVTDDIGEYSFYYISVKDYEALHSNMELPRNE